MRSSEDSPASPKAPKFKRCKINRPQLIVLMQHFGACATRPLVDAPAACDSRSASVSTGRPPIDSFTCLSVACAQRTTRCHHRLVAHRSYEASTLLRALLLLCACGTLQGQAIRWACRWPWHDGFEWLINGARW